MSDVALFSIGTYAGTALVAMLVACMVKFIYVVIHHTNTH